MRNIIVGTDGSESGCRAVTSAAKLAALVAAKLTIINVQESMTSAIRPVPQPRGSAMAANLVPNLQPSITLRGQEPTLPGLEVGNWVDRQVEAAKILMHARTLAEANGARDITAVTAAGEPAAEILSAAESVGADLIVVGRRGLTGLSAVLLGSVSRKLLHAADIDVLTVA